MVLNPNSVCLPPSQCRIVSGRTLVLGDLHLRPVYSKEDQEVYDWLRSEIVKAKPSWIILNGDTFELSLVKDVERTHSKELEKILKVHGGALGEVFFPPYVRGVILLPGDHDFRIPHFLDIVKKVLPSEKLDFSDVVYHADSGTAILHGHQFDFNIGTSLVNGVAFTERLSSLFESFILDGSGREEQFQEACSQGEFSFWYTAGKLPEYLKAAERKFGYGPREYWDKLTGLINSEFFARWAESIANPENRALARSAMRLTSGFSIPDATKMMGLAATIPKMIFQRRCVSVLRGGRFDPSLVNVSDVPCIRNLVVAHTHAVMNKRIRAKGMDSQVCAVTVPRAHVAGLDGARVELRKESAVVKLDGDRILYKPRRSVTWV